MEQPNLSYIKELAGDDVAFMQKFISIIKEEFPVEVKEYMRQLKNDQPREAAQIVHKLKHKFNILSLERAYILAVEYEEELRLGRIELHSKFITILKNIETYLKTI
ncbi:MAG: Hpt domain-containing protein [Maribacter sp.]|jgi:HPt (histidine-containing phosphotransfer) domain-containing protein|nr:Hpt domain-containing protein [Maribacter sp.]